MPVDDHGRRFPPKLCLDRHPCFASGGRILVDVVVEDRESPDGEIWQSPRVRAFFKAWEHCAGPAFRLIEESDVPGRGFLLWAFRVKLYRTTDTSYSFDGVPFDARGLVPPGDDDKEIQNAWAFVIYPGGVVTREAGVWKARRE